MELVNDEFFLRSKAYAHAVAMLLFPVEKKRKRKLKSRRGGLTDQ